MYIINGTIISLFIFGSFSCTPQERVNCGTQLLQTFIAQGNTYQKHPYIPDQELYYYDNYLVERLLKIKHTAGARQDGLVEYDTSYVFINVNTEDCVEYKRFLKEEVALKSFKLANKTGGIVFNQKMDSSLDYSSNKPLKDTVADGRQYKYFTLHTKYGPEEQIICYLTPNVYNPLFHLNKQVDNDYKAILSRIDIKDVKSDQTMSIRMDVKPSLTEDQKQVLQSWKQEPLK